MAYQKKAKREGRTNFEKALFHYSYSYSDAVKLFDIPATTIGNWCTGYSHPTRANALRISKFLGCSPSYLMGKSDDPCYVDSPPCTQKYGLVYKTEIMTTNFFKVLKYRSYTSEMVEKVFDIPVVKLNDWISGKTEIPRKYTKIFPDFFGCSLEFLIDISNDDPKFIDNPPCSWACSWEDTNIFVPKKIQKPQKYFGFEKVLSYRGYTAKEVTEIFDFSLLAVNNWEKGYSAPGYNDAERLAYFFGCSSDFLKGKSDDPKFIDNPPCQDTGKKTAPLKADFARSNLERVRLTRNVSNTDIVNLLFLNKQTVYLWNIGTNRPNPINASILGYFLGCSPLYLRGMSNDPCYVDNPPCMNETEKENLFRQRELFYDKGYMNGERETKKTCMKALAETNQKEPTNKLALKIFDLIKDSSAKIRFAAGLIDEPELFCTICNKLTDVEKIRLYNIA